ncbi:MAG TPA: hypothetical protein VKD90_22430 [Gemmataceae bacterium]|nr:hypothetical protein [Gemmataceae bacterium]
MRAVCLALAVVTVSSTGCAALIAGSGQDLAALKDRTEVHGAYGPPEVAGDADGQAFEEYLTRRKIADPSARGPGMAMVYGATYGLIDLIAVPYELYQVGRRTIQGQRLRFTYDADGQVTAIQFDGDEVPLLYRYSSDPDRQVTAIRFNNGDVWLPRRAEGRADDR